MRSCAPMAVSLLALLIVAPAFASPQIRDSGDANGAGVSYSLLPHAVIGEIQFAGLHRIPAEAAKSRLSVHPGDEFDSARIAADVRALSGVGWFADVTAKVKESNPNPESAVGDQRLQLQFHVTEYPFLIAVAFTGSTILSQQQIKKLLDDKKLSPQLGAPADPVRLHRVALAIQSELAIAGHPEAQALIKQEKLPGQRVKVEFQIRDGPRLPVVRVNFLGHPDVSDKVLRKQMRQLSPDAWFSEHAVESLRRDWEIRLHRNAKRQKGRADYRLRASPAFDSAAHIASVKFDFEPMPPYTVRRIEFRGNQRFPDRYLRRRIPVSEGQPLDEYAIEAGLARLARTGYFQPFKKEDVQIETHEAGRIADVTIHLREKGKQRITFSGGRQQFGSTLGLAYTVFNLLGLDEFLSTQIDGGPESLQLAIGLAKEGFLGSRGTLALSVFDTFLRPRLTPGVQGPFQRSRTEGVNLGWNYAVSDADAVGVNFAISRSVTQYVVNQSSSTAGVQVSDLRSKTSSHSLGIGWTHDVGEQRIQVANSVSGGWLGGNENLLKSKVEYGQIFPDKIVDHHNAWAFRATVSAAGSYKGDMPLDARFFSGDDLVRGLRPGELGPYQTLSTVSPSGATPSPA